MNRKESKIVGSENQQALQVTKDAKLRNTFGAKITSRALSRKHGLKMKPMVQLQILCYGLKELFSPEVFGTSKYIEVVALQQSQ